jgi:uncharacterized protein (DUF58 family)
MSKKEYSYSNNLLITTRKRLFSHLMGEHKSVFSGSGLDFKEIREYTTGDDIRHVNWKVTARNRTPSVNIFNEDKQLNIVLVYLNSGSIYFGTQKSKKETMIDVLANLSFAAMNKNDMVSSVFFSDKEEFAYKPSKNKTLIEENIKTAIDLNPLNKQIDYDNLSHYLLSKLKQKSLIFLIGDFLELPNLKLLGAKHELYCVVVRDHFEEDLKLMGEFNLLDTNSGDTQDISIDEASIKKYNELMQKHDKLLHAHFKKSKIRYKKIYTDDNVVSKLMQLLRS